MKTVEQLQSSYEKYFKLVSKYFGEEKAKKLEQVLGERLVVAPRGLTPREGGYPGALIDYALNVAKQSKQFADRPDLQKSLIRLALLHELGRLGDDTHEQFVSQDSSWHKEKLSQLYKYNEFCHKMSFIHRTMYFVAKFGFELNSDEWIAILTSGGFHLEENRYYARDNHVMSYALQLCKCMAEEWLKVNAEAENIVNNHVEVENGK